MKSQAQVNFFCPEQRAAFMLRPCEGFWEKIAKAREKFPDAQIHYPLDKCIDCKGDKLIPPQEGDAVVETDRGKMIRSQILEAMDRLIPSVGSSVTKKDLAAVLDIPVANLSFHVAKMHNSGLLKITSPGVGFPDQISWPTPPGETLSEKAVEVRKKEEIPEIVREKGEKEEIVREVEVEHSAPEHDEVEQFGEGVPPDPPEIPTGTRFCKNDDGRPAHKTSPYCLECCRENLKSNAAKGKEKPKHSLSDLSAKERLFNWTLENLPAFDPTWTQDVWERWQNIHAILCELSKDL